MIQILKKLAVFCKKTQMFHQMFWRKYLKNNNIVPRLMFSSKQVQNGYIPPNLVTLLVMSKCQQSWFEKRNTQNKPR
jgi:hypothetical protein